MSEEIRQHLAALTERNLAQGMSPDEARQAAERLFGHVEGVKEQCRDLRGLPWLESLLRDFRYGVRLLRGQPGFAAAAIVTLALGLGTSTTIFSIVHAVILRPLPYPDPGRLISIYESLPPKYPQLPVSPRMFLEWQKEHASLQASAVTEHIPVVVTGEGEASRAIGLIVSEAYFKVLGVPPQLGRTFPSADRDDPVVLSHRLWLDRFQGRRDVIGRKILINAHPFRILGVMPASFLPEEQFDPLLFLPLNLEPAGGGLRSRARFLEAIARLGPGVTLDQAAQALNLAAQRRAAQDPDTSQGVGLRIVPLLDTLVGKVRPVLLTLLGAGGFLLLIACVNVANLLLARASSRQKEIAMRSALGASRARLVRQFLCESLLISLLGSAGGILLTYGNLQLLLRYGFLPLPRADEIALDGSTWLFAGLLAVFTGLGFGLIPALQAARISLPEVMNNGGRGVRELRRRLRLRSALAVFEVALALVLLVAAGLFLRSFRHLRQVPVGFDPGAGVTLVTKAMLYEQRYPTPRSVLAFVDQAAARLAAVPGVESVAFSTSLPFAEMNWRAVTIAGSHKLRPMDMAVVGYYVVTPGYFPTLRIPLVRGRRFDARDTAGAASVAIVSEGFARRYFPDADPLGKFLQVADSNAWCEIVGVIADLKERGPAEPAGLQVYVPYSQAPSRFPLLIIRLAHPAPGLRAGLRAALDTIDPQVPLPEMSTTLDLPLHDSLSTQRLTLLVFAVFSGVALVLSTMGIYGVVAYEVVQRTPEIGIRMALGARPGQLGWLVFARNGFTVALGLVIGFAGALAAAPWLGPLLFGVDAADPLTFAGALVLLGGGAFIACWLPSRRALTVDPRVVLHDE